MVGHSSVKILSRSAWTMLLLKNLLYFIGDPSPFFIVIALTISKLGVVVSQAHVSTMSIGIYLNDSTILHQNESFNDWIKWGVGDEWGGGGSSSLNLCWIWFDLLSFWSR